MRRRGASYLEAGGEGGGDGAAEQGPRDTALRGHLCTSFLDSRSRERGNSFQSVVEGARRGQRRPPPPPIRARVI